MQTVFPNDAPMALSLFHTLFNVVNVGVQSWFIPQLAWIVTRLVPEQAEEAERKVNECRDRLRAEHLESLKQRSYGYEIGNAYSSLYAQYEKLADFAINVSLASGQ